MSKFSASGGNFLPSPPKGKPYTKGNPATPNTIWKTLHTGASRLIHPYKYIVTPPVLTTAVCITLNE